MEQKILSLKDDKIHSEVELIEYPAELIGGRNLIPNSKEEWSMDSKDSVKTWYEVYLTKNILEKGYYTISFEAKSTEPSDAFYVSLTVRSSSRIYFVPRQSSERVTNEWARYSFTANNTLDNIRNIIFCNSIVYASPTNTGVMTIRSLKLEKGTKATDWTSAPEDLGLTYPDFITEFKPSISDRYILTEELIEYPVELIGGRNLFSKVHSQRDTWYNNNGTTVRSASDSFAIAIKVYKGGDYTINFNNSIPLRRVWFIKDETILGAQSFDWVNGVNLPHIINVPEDATYIMVQGSKSLSDELIASLKIEKGTIPTDWTPAPEDLGLSYPDHIQSFGTSFSDNILINEFIEQ